MRKKRNTSYSAAALLLAMLLAALSGCQVAGEISPPMEPSQDMPPTLSEQVEREGSFEAQLYFLSADGLRLVPETREISYTGNISRAQAAVEALTQGPSSDLLLPSLPDNITLQRVELSSDACNVYLSSSYQPSATDWIKARAAIAATIYEAEGIGSINLYLNGMEPGYEGRPLGALAPITEQLDTYVANLEQEFRTWSEQTGTEAGSFESRTVTLYFTDLNGELLIARNSTVNYDRSEDRAGIAELLVGKLLDGDASLEPVVPADLTFAEAPTTALMDDFIHTIFPSVTGPENDVPHPQDSLTETLQQDRGEGVVILHFEKPSYDYDENIMAGALTLTITGYIPNIRGVAIYMRQDDGTYRNLSPDGLYFTREDFTDMIGLNVFLPFPDAEGSVLHRVPRAVPGKDAYDPQLRLAELFKEPADPGELYPYFTAEDIEDIYVVEDIAVLNWKAGFSEKLQALLADPEFIIPQNRRERLFIYSVVNAITEIPGIQRVWMLEDGNKLGTVGELYLGNALMRNPGIMIDE